MQHTENSVHFVHSRLRLHFNLGFSAWLCSRETPVAPMLVPSDRVVPCPVLTLSSLSDWPTPSLLGWCLIHTQFHPQSNDWIQRWCPWNRNGLTVRASVSPPHFSQDRLIPSANPYQAILMKFMEFYLHVMKSNISRTHLTTVCWETYLNGVLCIFFIFRIDVLHLEIFVLLVTMKPIANNLPLTLNTRFKNLTTIQQSLNWLEQTTAWNFWLLTLQFTLPLHSRMNPLSCRTSMFRVVALTWIRLTVTKK